MQALLLRLREGIRTDSLEEMQAVARELAAQLPPVSTLALHGDLGAGKTSFVQGLAQAWGISSLSSPTFCIYTLYQGTRQLCHLDAYRLKTPAEYEDLLIDELLQPPCCLAIEWPERLNGALPPDSLHLYFSIIAPGVHRVSTV